MRGDESLRLVLHLNHHQTAVYSLAGAEVVQAILRPHGLWGSGESAMGQVLLHYLENHHRELLNRIVGIESPNDDGLSDGEILALDRPRGTSDLKAGSSLPSS